MHQWMKKWCSLICHPYMTYTSPPPASYCLLLNLLKQYGKFKVFAAFSGILGLFKLIQDIFHGSRIPGFHGIVTCVMNLIVWSSKIPWINDIDSWWKIPKDCISTKIPKSNISICNLLLLVPSIWFVDLSGTRLKPGPERRQYQYWYSFHQHLNHCHSTSFHKTLDPYISFRIV